MIQFLYHMETFADWLEQQIKLREWRPADLARVAGIKDATISRILSGTRQAGPGACTAIAKALDMPVDRVFRIAGLLPSQPEHNADAKEAADIIANLPTHHRRTAMDMLRALAGRVPPVQPPPGPDEEPKPWQIRRELTEEEVKTWNKLFYDTPPSARPGLVLMLQEFVEYFEDIRRGLWESTRDVEPRGEPVECGEGREGIEGQN